MGTTSDGDDTVVLDRECDDLAPVFSEHSLTDPRQRTNWTDIGPEGVRQPPRVEY